MSRLIFWLILILVVLYAIRVKLKKELGPPPADKDGRAEGFVTRGAVEDMACCAHCGVYFPASEAVEAGGKAYCSAAHARQPGA